MTVTNFRHFTFANTLTNITAFLPKTIMKKIGVITDVHGNIDGLKLILDYFENICCEEIIHTGDIVDIGPKARECFDLLMQKKVTCLLGNHDRDFVMDNPIAQHLSHVPTAHKQYVFATLTEEHRNVAKNFPLYVERNCGGKRLLFCHYPLDWQVAKNNPFGKEFPFLPIVHEQRADQFDQMTKNLPYDAVFFGHKHEFADVVGERIYVNVGSVGCHPDAWAQGVVIEYDDTSWTYRRVHIPYDMEKIHQAMQQIPHGEELYKFYFLRIPQ